MDMSKLPRLSRTDRTDAPPAPSQGAGSPAGAGGSSPARRVPDDADGYDRARGEPPPSFLVEAWLSIGLGLLILLVFPTMVQFASSKVLHTRFGPYDAFDSAGNEIHDADGKPARADYVTLRVSHPDGSETIRAVPYARTTPDVSPNFWNDFVLTAFALALIVEGAALALSRRAAVVLPALAVTTVATLANLVYFLKTFQEYGMPLWSAIAVLFGGYMAFSQWRLLQWRLAPAPAPAPAPAAPVDPTRALLGKVLGGGPKARCTHYKFAHQALRQAAMQNPTRCVGLLQSPSSQRFLNDLWEAVRSGCTQAADPGDAPEPGPAGLEADMTQVGPYSAVLVTLPQPLFPTEAYYVALVLRSYVRAEDGLTIERHPLLLYYTLEHNGTREDGSPRTTLAEWQAGTHLSYGQGPAPDAAAFRDAVREKVNQLQRREDEAAGKASFT